MLGDMPLKSKSGLRYFTHASLKVLIIDPTGKEFFKSRKLKSEVASEILKLLGD